MIPLRRKRKL